MDNIPNSADVCSDDDGSIILSNIADMTHFIF